jgi:hypothetical protein
MIKKTGLEPNHFFIYKSSGIRISQDNHASLVLK